MNTTEHGKSKKAIGIEADDASSWFMGNTEFGKVHMLLLRNLTNLRKEKHI